MPAVLAGNLTGDLPDLPDDDPFPIKHPGIPSTELTPYWTTRAAFEAVWFGRGWELAYP